MGLALVACTKAGSGVVGGRHSWTHPGVLRVAVQQDLKNLNPLLNSNTTDVFVDRLMFEPLLTADPKGNALPMLAAQVPTLENGGISSDGMTITYHLRKARWTDGVAVTSGDVKWSWQAIMNPDNNVVSRHGYDYVASIDTPNVDHGDRASQAAVFALREHVLRRERSAVHARAGARAGPVSEHQQRPVQ